MANPSLTIIACASALLAGGCSADADNRAGTGIESATAGQSGDPYTSVSNGSGSPAGDPPAAGPDTPVSSDDPAPGQGGVSPGWNPGDGKPPPAVSSACPILGSSGWTAHVNAMPGPNSRRTLHVSGTVRVPSAGYKASLSLGPIAETYPLNVTVLLRVKAPSGAAAEVVSNVPVKGTWPVEGDVGAVTIRCGGKTVGHVSPVQTAH